MDTSSDNYVPSRVHPRTNIGEYDDVDRRLFFDYATSAEIKDLQKRAARSEVKMEYINHDYKNLMAAIRNLRWWVLGIGIGSVVAIVGAMICFAQWQGSWFQDAINARQQATEKLNDEMERRWQAINAEQQKRFEIMLDRLDKRTDRIERNME